MRLRFTPRAIHDLSNIADYIRERSPAASRRVRTSVLASLQKLLMFPSLGRPQTTEGVRKLVTQRYSYLVYYTIDVTADEIVVLSVKHPAQKRAYEDS